MDYLPMEALLNYGFQEEPREPTRRTARMIRRQGLWEFYDYRNDRGAPVADAQPTLRIPEIIVGGELS